MISVSFYWYPTIISSCISDLSSNPKVIWRFPEIGRPPLLIHWYMVYSLINPPAVGIPPSMETIGNPFLAIYQPKKKQPYINHIPTIMNLRCDIPEYISMIPSYKLGYPLIVESLSRSPGFPGCAVPRTTMAWFRNWQGGAMGVLTGVKMADSPRGKYDFWLGKIWEKCGKNVGKIWEIWENELRHGLKPFETIGFGWILKSFEHVKFNRQMFYWNMTRLCPQTQTF